MITTWYKTSDGQVFNDEVVARKHEEQLDMQKRKAEEDARKKAKKILEEKIITAYKAFDDLIDDYISKYGEDALNTFATEDNNITPNSFITKRETSNGRTETTATIKEDLKKDLKDIHEKSKASLSDDIHDYCWNLFDGFAEAIEDFIKGK